MATAYLVLAHAHPEHLLRLLDHLDDGVRLVHWDPRSVDQGRVRRALAQRGVTQVPGREVHWGHWSLVAATLEGIRMALSDDAVERVVLLSGADYPLVPQTERTAWFDALGDRSAFTWLDEPGPGIEPDGGLRRTRWVHVRRRGRRPGMQRLPVPRRPPRGLRIAIGHQWVVLGRPAASDVVALGPRDALWRTFRWSEFPDEAFFQTAVLNGPHAARVLPEDLHYIDWSVRPGPKVLAVEDLPAMASSGRLFARKFAPGSPVLDVLDRRL